MLTVLEQWGLSSLVSAVGIPPASAPIQLGPGCTHAATAAYYSLLTAAGLYLILRRLRAAHTRNHQQPGREESA